VNLTRLVVAAQTMRDTALVGGENWRSATGRPTPPAVAQMSHHNPHHFVEIVN
jgi:hypothetical protein